MKVSVSVHGRFHGFDLARELNRYGVLGGLITTYPRFAVRPHLGAIDNLFTIPSLELRRRICQRFNGLCGDIDGRLAQSFAKFAAAHLPPCDLLVGWSSATLEAIPVARERGARVVIERGSSHVLHQTNLLKDLHARDNKVFTGTSSLIIERELAEYESADSIAVPSSYAAQTFASHGIPLDKILVNPYGVDLEHFSPTPSHANKRPKILFVGLVGIRKGVPELLSAFSRLSSDAELCLIGPLEAGMPEPLQAKVQHLGAVPISELPNHYRSADIFCLPSWEEGFPLVILQAMASGLPVVTTDASGAQDIIISGIEGEIVSAGDIDALAQALQCLVEDPVRAQEMGAAARARVNDGFDWASYGSRAYDIYRGLMEERSPSD